MNSLNQKKTVINPANGGAEAACYNSPPNPLSLKRGGRRSRGVSFPLALLMLLPGLGLAQTPAIVSTYPAPNALDVPLDTTISATFSSAPSTINATTFIVHGSFSGLISGSYAVSGNTATFTSNTPYMVGEVVSVILTTGTGLPVPYSWAFHIATEGGSGKFIQTATLATGSNLRDVVAGDWDGDGDVDLAVSGGMDYYVRIWTNDGTGGFTQTSSLSIDSGPYALAAGDWDEDGDQDLAVTQEHGSSVTILANDGSGAFTKTVSVSVGSYPYGITPGDWDGDGDPDLAVANHSSNNVSILINGGLGIFTSTGTVGVGNNPYDVISGDWDGDGDVDLAVPNYSSNNVSILINDGSGTFSLASSPGTAGSPYSVAAGDWDGDSDPDLAIANGWSNNVSIFTNDGGANFSQDSTLYLDHNAYELETGDLDGDGSLDLFVVSSDTSASVLMNDGLGGFTKSAQDIGGGTGLVLGDWDNDGDLDAAISGYNTINIVTNRNRAAQAALSTNTLAYGATTIGGSAELSFTIHNHGVDSTLRVSNITASNSVYVPSPTTMNLLPGESAVVTVTFAPTTIAFYNDSLALSTNDPDQPEVKVYVSGYGFPIAGHTPAANAHTVSVGSDISVTFSVDMAGATIDANTFVVHGSCTGRLSGVCNYNEGTKTATFSPGAQFKVGEQVSVTLTTGITSAESIPLPIPYAWSFRVEALGGSSLFVLDETLHMGDYSYPRSVAAGDWNGDGYMDMVVTLEYNVAIMMNDGQGQFIKSVIENDLGLEKSFQGNVSGLVVAGDWDSDGDADFAVGNQWDQYVALFHNDGVGQFTRSDTVRLSSNTYALAAGDWDGDGDLDLAATSSSYISYMSNDGSGDFALANTESVGSEHYSIASGDWDGDGDVDLAVTNAMMEESISILANDGNGTFFVTVSAGVGSNPYSLIDGDWDNDGDLDLAVANQSSNNVSIVINDGAGGFTQSYTTGVGNGPRFITAGDWDGDGDLDLATANESANTVSILSNNGTGGFVQTTALTVGSNPYGLAVGDWDDNGSLDLAVTNNDDHTLSLLLNEVDFSARISLSSRIEQSDTIDVSYRIFNPEDYNTNLVLEFSLDDGTTWHTANIIGATSALGPQNYQGTLQWASYADLPGLDLPAVRLRITPYDLTGEGRAYTTAPFHLDNNHEPVADISPLTGEQSGDVVINYTLQDDEQDTLSFVAQYSRDRGKTWLEATVSGSRTGLLPATYSGSLTWDTNTDLPGWEDSLTYFRILPSDYEPGEPGEVVLHVDNNDPPALALGALLSDTVVSRVSIPFVLSDPENDTLSIVASYSLDGGQGWLPSAVAIEGRAIAPADYSGTVEWLAFANGLAGQHDNVQLQILPYDYDPGVGDTLTGLTVIYYPGDYTGDLAISTDDLAQFAAAWNTQPQDLAYEIGPATGTVPELIPQPDGVMDFEDLTVFAQMWNWSFAHNGFAKSIPVLAKAISENTTIRLVQRMPDDLYRWDGAILVDLFVDDTEGLMMVDGVVSYAPRSLQLIEVADGGYLNQFFKATPLLTQVSPDSSQALFALVGLGTVEPGKVDDLPLATLRFKPKAHKSLPLILDYTLTGMDGGPFESGQVQFEVENLMPLEFALHQNYPNPFNPTTIIRFELPKATKVYLVVYDILGREVTRLVDSHLEAGYRQVIWNGKDGYGRDIASGIYIVRMLTPEYTRSIKTLLLK